MVHYINTPKGILVLPISKKVMKNSILYFLTAVALLLPSLLNSQTEIGEVINLPGRAFKYSTTTSASKPTIWRLWTDVENWKKFDTLLEYSSLVESVSFGESAVGFLKAEGAPRTRFEIRNVIEGESFLVHLFLPLYQSIDQQRYFEANNTGGTTFTHEVTFKGGLSPIVYLLLSRIYKRETQLVVERLKVVAEVERQGTPD